MPDRWIIRVDGKEYGPVDLEVLKEWKREGRLLSANEARLENDTKWITAGAIGGLFSSLQAIPAQRDPPQVPQRRGSLFTRTFQIYGRGFFQYLGLSALIILPSLFGQFVTLFAERFATNEVNFAGLLSAAFSFFMMVLVFVMWPVYLAGLQIVTSELAVGCRVSLATVLNRAAKFWPRVATLCVIVYGGFFLLFLFLTAIFAITLATAQSPLLAIPVLMLLALQVWLFGRWFINVLFWQQAAVIENATVPEALQQSKQLARSRRDLAWYQRPLWRGALIASIWMAFISGLDLWVSWSAIRHAFDLLMTNPDPQAFLSAMTAEPKSTGLDLPRVCLSLLQSVLRPLLGIAFVLLYFDARRDFAEREFVPRDTDL